jgi:protein O-mannosyl-transferase
MAQRSKRKQQSAPSRPPAQIDVILAAFLAAIPWKIILQAAIIVALGTWIYWPSLYGLYLWDDDFLLQTNATVHDPNGLVYIWTDPQHALIDFFPLTVSVEWLIWQIWGPTVTDPQFLGMTIYYHATSLFLHLVNCMLVWYLFRRLGIRLAWLGALLFTVHPVIVESVAWMSELKNTIALPPFILAMLAWLSYDRTRRPEYYVAAFVLYFISMLAKTSGVMFPVIILLYDWWKHGRIGAWDNIRSVNDFIHRATRALEEQLWNFLPTIPFFVIAISDAWFLILYLRHGVGEQFIPGLLGGPLGRTACAGLSLIFYFSKCILPVNLLPIYPQWVVTPPSFTLEYLLKFLPWPVMALGFWWLLKRREQPWARAAVFGFGFFFLSLLPFVGWRAISFMRFGWVMDHFLYVPILGLIGLAAAAAGDIYERLPRSTPAWRLAAISTVVVVLAVFTVGSHRYAKVFVNRLAYWTYSANHNFMGWPAHNNRGNELLNDGNYEEAEKEFKIALALNPVYTEAHNNLGFIYSRQGRYEEAIAEFREALKYTPDFEAAQLNLQRVLQLETARLQQQQQQQPQK